MKFGQVIPQKFYNRDAEIVARDLMGMTLQCTTPDGVCAGRIVETEAYIGEHDLACHAASGRTKRTEIMYGPPGLAYVYFIYGMHWCVNAVTREEGYPSAVLIRAVEPMVGIDLMWQRRPRAKVERDLANGPAKLCAAFGIDGTFNGTSLQSGQLKILFGEPYADKEIATTPRIGISKCVEWPLRWVVK